MPDLLLELFSEEIPARMQARAAEDLRRMVTDRLVDAGLVYEGATAFATPRRLALAVQGIPLRQPDLKEEKKGPRVGAPDAAVQGFVKSAGLGSIAEATVQRDPKKGDFYVALIEKPGRPAIDVLAELIPQVIRTFPWPKSMRWGERSARPGALTWVRPLHGILATFGPETSDPDVVPFEVDGVGAGNTTHGHRFLAPGAITVKHFADYTDKLEKARVTLDPARRRQIILTDAKHLAFAQGLELVEDEALLEEVAGLVEWPVVLMGSFDEDFLRLPPEVIRTTIRVNQKCFVVRHAGGGLANRFILVSNIEARDGGRAIVAGNERVIRARLSDARFFYETDLRTRLEDRLAKFAGIVFHEKIGSQAERVARIVSLAAGLAPAVGADPDKAKRAALLAKADLLTEMVGEFPELQGLMGRYYARAQGEDDSVAAALEDHYRPHGPADRVPSDPVAVVVALADKIDTLTGFFAIGERPSGSKDPYGLRRAALGVIRLVLAGDLRVKLLDPLGASLRDHGRATGGAPQEAVTSELLSFLADRLKVQLREQGARHDLVDAVFALEGQDDLVMIIRRVEALAAFLDTEDGKNLLAGYKRAANILRIEEKRDNTAYTGAPSPQLYREAEERALAGAITTAAAEAGAAVAREDFASAMSAMARLRPHVDAFFDKVTVNADDAEVRANRLRLLNEIRAATRTVADFSRIEG